jgi:hypothetical protein
MNILVPIAVSISFGNGSRTTTSLKGQRETPSQLADFIADAVEGGVVDAVLEDFGEEVGNSSISSSLIPRVEWWSKARGHAFLIEIAFRGLRVRVRFFLKTGPVLINQFGKAGARLLVTDNPRPLQVASKLGKKLRQVLKEFVALTLLERANGFFDLLRRAHFESLPFGIAARNTMAATVVFTKAAENAASARGLYRGRK